MISAPSSSFPSLLTARKVFLISHVGFLLYACLVANFIRGRVSEYVQEFQVSEGIKVGSVIGYIGDSSIETSSVLPSPPYLIVPVPGSAVDTDLLIDQSTGEIRTNVQLDRETRDVYFLIAVPISGENVRVIIRVNDENDNAPSFPVSFMTVEFPENTPRDVKRTLPPALDPDVGLYTTQRYDISSGNANNAFRLSSHREKDGILYLDLQVNGFLDREAIPVYRLILNAYDGGRPALKGSMIVNVTIEDVNDNQPVFNQSRYSASISEDASVGSSVLQVFAHDADDLDNGRITYFINRRQSDKEAAFRIDPVTGAITLNRPLDFESKDTHELVIVARDNGPQALEATAFVTVHVLDVNDNQPIIDLIFLSEDGTPKVAENAQPGEFLVRISVSDADSSSERSNVNVSLSGGEDFFGLSTRDEVVYSIFVAKSLDREKKSEYSLEIAATDHGDPPLHACRFFNLVVTDVNDNAPRFDKQDYFATVAEAAEPGTAIIQVHAADPDEGDNARVVYSLRKHRNASLDWFHVDPTSGLITTSTHVDCEVDPMPQIVVVATDSGSAPLSSSATVSVIIRDVNDNEPIFDQSFYNVSVHENETVGTCILKVSATDRDCGINALINYTLGEAGSSHIRKLPFRVLPETGQVCVADRLDFEARSTYEFPVSATDKGGLSTTAVVKVHLIDVNDNFPVFYPREYNVSLRPGHSTRVPVVAVMAVDGDSEKFGTVSYRIDSADVSVPFRVDSATGEIFATESLRQVDKRTYRLMVSAVDNEGRRSRSNAEVLISIIDPSAQPPIFEQPRYVFSILENASLHSHVGRIRAVVKSPTGPGHVKYSISSGDPGQYFKIDPDAGIIVTNSQMDHETKEFVLLSVLAAYGEPPAYGHAQVNITILDVNDNAPEFESSSVKIFLPENAPLESAVYVAHAEDADSETNGKITYKLIEDAGIYKIDADSGALTLAQKLDYERTKHYSIVVEARDSGVDPLSSQLTINIEVQDVNDNFPVFDRMHYEARVLESLVTNSQFLRVRATDKDTGNNARITYKICEDRTLNNFGIFPHSGWIYLKEDLDRESTASYSFEVIATDNGIRPLQAKASVTVTVLDVNDNDPYFFQQSYFFHLPENFVPTKTVAFLNATDRDEGENSDLRFTLSPEDPHFEIKHATGEASRDNSYFAVDANSGSVTVRQALHDDAKRRYNIKIGARDGGKPPLYSVLALIVEALNSFGSANNRNLESALTVRALHFVLFSFNLKMQFEIKEDVNVGSKIGSLTTSNRSAAKAHHPPLSYFIVSGNEGAAFHLNHQTGDIYTAAQLDRETVAQYSLLVEVYADDQHVSSVRVNVQIDDVNDNPPQFSKLAENFTVPESSAVGTVVANVTAVDKDSDANALLTYSLEHQYPVSSFDLDSNTGVITLRSALDHENVSHYVLIVVAADKPDDASQKLSSWQKININVLDVNDNPPKFLSQDKIEVYENERVGSTLLRIIAVDDDSGQNAEIAYSIVAGNEESMFHLNSSTGVLTLQNFFNRNRKSLYQLNITVTDGGSPPLSQWQMVKIFVHDVFEEKPKFDKVSYDATVMENRPPGTHVLSVSVKVDNYASEHYRNLSYSIEQGLDKSFRIDSNSGMLMTTKALDREERGSYVVSVLLQNSWTKHRYDVALVRIQVLDVNDNYPEFKNCHSLYIPENNDFSVVRFIIATDPDDGVNSELTYNIVSGNKENKFSVDLRSGKLSTRSLNRETAETSEIVIAVQDGGTPPRKSFCNMTVVILDENDNDPFFDQLEYTAEVPEDCRPGTEVLTVHATDLDVGVNARVVYSLTNETASNFIIDNKTGLIKTKGHLDRELASILEFKVKATDGGRYAVRSAYANVRVVVRDVNDNSPRFRQYPFWTEVSAFTQPGSKLLRIAAEDADENLNGKIEYRFQEKQQLFKLEPDSGIITTTTSLTAEAGQLFRLPVIALDQGSPQKSSLGLVEIKVQGYEPTSSLQLSFSNSTYEASVAENAVAGTVVVKVAAGRSDARKQSIYYSLVEMGENRMFEIDRSSGVIQVRDNIDYERQKKIVLMVEAKSEDAYAHATVWVTVLNRNDHAPVFTQDLYLASVWEGNNKGAFVVEVRATDKDDDSDRSKISYSITEGNHDNAFMIDSSFSGVVKTNIVLDREIAERYELVITAVDEGEVQLTGTCTLAVSIIDVNDNQPIFPPQDSIFVSEDTAVGSIITAVAANDVDTFPVLMYTFVENNSHDYFRIDLYSGEITLAHPLDYEKQKSHTLHLLVSDSAHTAETTLTVHVSDVNDNAPLFALHSYFAVLPQTSGVGEQVLVTEANDADSGNNGKLKYSLLVGPTEDFFYIDEDAGVIRTNQTSRFTSGHEVRKFIVVARDMGRPALSSMATVQIQISDVNHHPPIFAQVSYRTGEIFLVKKLDVESTETYNLKITASDRGIPSRKSSAELVITAINHLDSFPSRMRQKQYEVSLNESVEINHKILAGPDAYRDVKATYRITVGNEASLFQVNSSTGELLMLQRLDYDTVGGSRHVLLITTYKEDQHMPFCLTTVIVNVEDSNDNAPAFPLDRYEIFVPEDFPAGAPLTQIRAVDLDFGVYGVLNYTISDGNESEFSIDHQTAVISARKNFDYEARSTYRLKITATDPGGNKTTTNLVVNIKSQDEYPPVFSQPLYRFLIADNLPRSHIIGTVHATDQDTGVDGRVVYRLKTFDKYFCINESNGTVFVTKLFFSEYKALNVTTIDVLIEANSGKMQSLTSSVVAEITIDPSFKYMKEIFILEENKGITYWAVSLVIIFTVLASCGTGALVYLRVRNKKRNSKTPLAQHYDSAFDAATNESCYLPHYNDIATYDVRNKGMHHQRISTREFSERSHSSGRGSAEEDVDDEEIKMINEGQLLTQKHFGILPDSGVQELDDNASDISVRNTQEYLARLGIDTGTQSGSHHDIQDVSDSMHSMHMFDDEGGGEGEGIVDISSIICRKVNVSNNEKNRINTDTKRLELDETHPSMSGSLSSVIHSEEELTGSYNWDYLLDWGPQYQPLAHVFSEIASLKDDDAPISSFTTVMPKKVNFSHTKVIPPSSPPILTNIIPRKSIPPSITLNKQKASQQLCLPSSNSDLLKLTTPALSPSFSPSLSPLARRSPSVSPLIHSYRTVQPYYISMPISSDVTPEKEAQPGLELRI